MLRVGSNILGRTAISDTKFGSSAFALEFVRWRRKPRWLPVAKSKVFRVPEHKQQSPDEKAELMRLHNNYKTQLRSVRQYLREEAQRIAETSTADHIVMTPEQEEQEFQRCISENDAWNKVIAEERNKRLEKEREERSIHILERLELARIRNEERMEQIEAIVKREKELSASYITRDKLDVAIEQALANPVDYNFSIDLKGNIYRGRNTMPSNSGGTPATGDQHSEKEEIQASN